MLTPRNAIITVVTLAVVSLLVSVIQLTRPPDSDGKGWDSYGTRAFGQRALFEILEELGVPVSRGLMPPLGYLGPDVCMAFLDPDPNLANAEPEYLRRAADWVAEGGTVVLAAPAADYVSRRSIMEGIFTEPTTQTTAMELLGLEGIRMDSVGEREDRTPATSASSSAWPPLTRPQGPSKRPADWTEKLLPAVIKPGSSQSLRVRCGGSLAHLSGKVTRLRAPEKGLQVIAKDGATSPTGWVKAETDDGTLTVAAVYPIDRGRVVVIAEPELLANHLIAKDDNAVLAAHLLALAGRPVVVDEFYHGLTIRGNPTWLLTQFPYALLVLLVVLLASMWAWHGWVRLGPPVPAKGASRRSVVEYIAAMATLFGGRRCRQFVLKELRDGGLWALRHKLGLPPGCETVEVLAKTIARRDPERAERLRRAVEGLDAVLQESRQPDKSTAVRAARHLDDCVYERRR